MSDSKDYSNSIYSVTELFTKHLKELKQFEEAELPNKTDDFKEILSEGLTDLQTRLTILVEDLEVAYSRQTIKDVAERRNKRMIKSKKDNNSNMRKTYINPNR